MRKCFKCEKELQSKYRMVAIDRPYVNVFFCEECFLETFNDLEKYLVENYEYLLKYIEILEINSKKRKNVI